MIEHRLIEQVISMIEKESEVISATGKVNIPLLTNMVDFMRTYADKCHHGKEEGILFDVLEKKDMDVEHRAMMDKLIDDHRRSRELTSNLNDLLTLFIRGERAAVENVVENLQTLASIYPDHIRREDKLFFPIAMKYLSTEEREDMLRQFKEFDARLIHDHYKAEVGRMKAQMGAVQ